MKEQMQPEFTSGSESRKQEEELSPEEIRERVEGAMAKIREGVPEGDERVFKNKEVPFGIMYSHFADMIMASAYAFTESGYLTDEEKLLLVGRESNIIYIAGFLDRQTEGRFRLRSNFREYFDKKISGQNRRKYRLSKTRLKPVEQ